MWRLLASRRSLASNLLLAIIVLTVLSLKDNILSNSFDADHLSVESNHKVKRSCSPLTKVAFAKTHKTGSSTLQNIFFRFGVRRNLTFALPPKKTWMFSFKERFNSSLVLDGPFAPLGDFHMFVFHSVWDYNEVSKVVPGAKFFTLLRDPVDCFESNYVYMGLQNRYGMDINKFAKVKIKDGKLARRPAAVIDKNQQLWDLGVTAEEMENETVVEEKIRQFDKQFDLVLVTERFEESLVLMGDELCWPTQDLTYLVQNRRVAAKRSNMTDETRRALRRWLWADQKLYDHFAKVLAEKVRRAGEKGVSARARELRRLNGGVRAECVLRQGSDAALEGDAKMALPIVQGYVTDKEKPWCALFARSEPSFSKRLRNYQELLVESRVLRGSA